MDFVYILKCNDNTYYTGWTCHPQERLKTHNNGKGAKYTRSRLPAQMVYLELLPDKRTALQREYAIKKLTRKNKEKLIEIYQKKIPTKSSFIPIVWLVPTESTWAPTIPNIPLDMQEYPITSRKTISPKKNKENL